MSRTGLLVSCEQREDAPHSPQLLAYDSCVQVCVHQEYVVPCQQELIIDLCIVGGTGQMYKVGWVISNWLFRQVSEQVQTN